MFFMIRFLIFGVKDDIDYFFGVIYRNELGLVDNIGYFKSFI